MCATGAHAETASGVLSVENWLIDADTGCAACIYPCSKRVRGGMNGLIGIGTNYTFSVGHSFYALQVQGAMTRRVQSLYALGSARGVQLHARGIPLPT